jgi:Fe-S oxidoreductase/nitrate reductase gamma subunit
MNPLPLRDTFWNVPGWAVVGIYVGGAVALAICAWGLYRRVALWREGGPEMRWDRLPERFKALVREVLLQARILTQNYPGIMHATLFWGFLTLFAGTVIATIDWEITRLLFDFRLLQGPFYLFFELTLDLFGVFLTIGLGMAVWRRFVKRPARIEASGKFAYALAVLFVIAVTGFLIEAARLAVTQPPWAAWSPVGWGMAQAMLAAGASEAGLRTAHLSLWLFHAVVVLGFIALIPQTFFVHLFATPLNIFFAKLGPRGALAKIDNLEEQETFGVSEMGQFSWKRRLDFDACVECGRCHDACCVQKNGGVLSPKRVIGKLKRHMLERDARPLHGEVIGADELWACTTCSACVQACPARIDIVDTIVDLRRYLGLSEGAFPGSAAQTLKNIERAGNPWGLDPGSRLAWAEGLDVPVLAPGRPVEYLYWVGCSAAYDNRSQKIARAVVKVLKAAGVSFGVMAEERCHGEVARRLGEEYLYQTVTAENIANLRSYRFEKILAHCPHCFNTLKNEYPQFDGGAFEVVHHSTAIAELLRGGRLNTHAGAARRVAFHDPCYLGRYNGVLDAPRELVRRVAGAVAEIEPGRERSMCCGAGGGRMWMDDPGAARINVQRTRQALDAAPDVIAVACPFCTTMISDGVAELGAQERVTVKDVAELVAESLFSPNNAAAS